MFSFQFSERDPPQKTVHPQIHHNRSVAQWPEPPSAQRSSRVRTPWSTRLHLFFHNFSAPTGRARMSATLASSAPHPRARGACVAPGATCQCPRVSQCCVHNAPARSEKDLHNQASARIFNQVPVIIFYAPGYFDNPYKCLKLCNLISFARKLKMQNF